MRVNRFILVLVFILSIFSCATRNTIILNSNGSGTVDANISINNLLVNYIFDLQEVMTETPVKNRTIFDKKSITSGLAKSSSVKLIDFQNNSNNSMTIKLAFNDINKVISEAETSASHNKDDIKLSEDKIRNIINFKKVNKGYKFNFYLDNKNFSTLASLIPEEAKMMVTMLGPSFDPTDEKLTREDYYQLLEEILADYPESKNIRTLVDNSSIILTIKTAGNIISQKGGVIQGKSVTFKIPVLDLVILEKPIDLEVLFN